MFAEFCLISFSRQRLLGVVVTMLALWLGAAHAAQLDQLQNLGQEEVILLAQDLTAALSYKPMQPAAPLGLTGFDIGLDAHITGIQAGAALTKASSSSYSAAVIPLAALHIYKGLPFDIDVGVTASKLFSWTVYGGELRYALVSGGVLWPAVSLRAAYTQLTGSSQLSFSSQSYDVSVSKGFLFLTPYAGVGQVRGKVNLTNLPDGVTLDTTIKPVMNKVYGGLNVSLGILALAYEMDKTGADTTNSLKIALRW